MTTVDIIQLANDHRQVVIGTPQREISILASRHESPLQAIERHAEELQCDIDARQRRVNFLRAAAAQLKED